MNYLVPIVDLNSLRSLSLAMSTDCTPTASADIRQGCLERYYNSKLCDCYLRASRLSDYYFLGIASMKYTCFPVFILVGGSFAASCVWFPLHRNARIFRAHRFTRTHWCPNSNGGTCLSSRKSGCKREELEECLREDPGRFASAFIARLSNNPPAFLRESATLYKIEDFTSERTPQANEHLRHHIR